MEIKARMGGANGDIERKGSLINRRVVTPSPLRRMGAAACRDQNQSLKRPSSPQRSTGKKQGKCLPAAGTPTPRGQGGGGVDAWWRCQRGGTA